MNELGLLEVKDVIKLVEIIADIPYEEAAKKVIEAIGSGVVTWHAGYIKMESDSSNDSSSLQHNKASMRLEELRNKLKKK